jgi:hypothetical protein
VPDPVASRSSSSNHAPSCRLCIAGACSALGLSTADPSVGLSDDVLTALLISFATRPRVVRVRERDAERLASTWRLVWCEPLASVVMITCTPLSLGTRRAACEQRCSAEPANLRSVEPISVLFMPLRIRKRVCCMRLLLARKVHLDGPIVASFVGQHLRLVPVCLLLLRELSQIVLH